MEYYSQTQTTNIASIVGVLVLLLNHFGINIAGEELTTLIGGVIAVSGVAMNWIHRYKKGDITLSGFRKI
jgi:hypothetical protein